MDLTKFVLGADVWLGNQPLDEATLKANGIKYMLVRANLTAGQLEYDPAFLTQWKESRAAGFNLAAYIVVSPTNFAADGKTFYHFTSKEVADWILSWVPPDCTVIGLDLEIDARALYLDPTITPKYYSDFLHGIYDILIAAGKKKLQYSGGWFFKLNAVSPWVSTVPQWWARYPFNPLSYQKDSNGNVIYPVLTWDQLKSKIAAQNWDPFGGYVTEAQVGHVVMWQICSAFVLPGCAPNQPIDIDVMSVEDYEALWPPEKPVDTLETRIVVLENTIKSIGNFIDTDIKPRLNVIELTLNKVLNWFNIHFPDFK